MLYIFNFVKHILEVVYCGFWQKPIKNYKQGIYSPQLKPLFLLFFISSQAITTLSDSAQNDLI